MPRFHLYSKGWLAFAAALLVASLLGVVINLLRPTPLPWSYASPKERIAQQVAHILGAMPADSLLEAAPEIPLPQVKRLLETRKVLALDARPHLFYESGHLPDARPLARDSFSEDYSKLSNQLQSDLDRQIIVYCADPDCPDARYVARALLDLGHRKVTVFRGGWQEWEQSIAP